MMPDGTCLLLPPVVPASPGSVHRLGSSRAIYKFGANDIPPGKWGSFQSSNNNNWSAVHFQDNDEEILFYAATHAGLSIGSLFIRFL
jgi:hypothetical protein